MLWIVLALLSVNAALIVWLACAASGREDNTWMAQQKSRIIGEANSVLQPVLIPVRVEERRQ